MLCLERLTRLFVLPDAAGSGLGRRLLEIGIETARKGHSGSIRLEATINAEGLLPAARLLKTIKRGYFSHGLGGDPIGNRSHGAAAGYGFLKRPTLALHRMSLLSCRLPGSSEIIRVHMRPLGLPLFKRSFQPCDVFHQALARQDEEGNSRIADLESRFREACHR